jgi:hypothetical protein
MCVHSIVVFCSKPKRSRPLSSSVALLSVGAVATRTDAFTALKVRTFAMLHPIKSQAANPNHCNAKCAPVVTNNEDKRRTQFQYVDYSYPFISDTFLLGSIKETVNPAVVGNNPAVVGNNPAVVGNNPAVKPAKCKRIKKAAPTKCKVRGC